MTEQVGLAISIGGLLFFRTSSRRLRWSIAALAITLLLLVPVGICFEADRLSFTTIASTLAFSLLNALVILVWGLVARVPNTDIAGLGVLCAVSAAIVLSLLLNAMSPPRMF